MPSMEATIGPVFRQMVKEQFVKAVVDATMSAAIEVSPAAGVTADALLVEIVEGLNRKRGEWANRARAMEGPTR